ncbi:hypothetical protein CMK11_18930 [Candidatus Poribacteria bacterium]|nr:hypothetical protein [Candidatus Poribacteria bacterium]
MGPPISDGIVHLAVTNGIVFVIELFSVLLLFAIGAGVMARGVRKILALPFAARFTGAAEAFERQRKRGSRIGVVLLGGLLFVGNVTLTLLDMDSREIAQAGLLRLQSVDPVAAIVGIAKVVALIVVGVVINVVGQRLLNLADRRVCVIDQIEKYHSRISDVIHRVRQLLRYTITIGVLLLATTVFTPPASVRTYGWILASGIVALPVGLLLARIAHVVVDALYDFSDLLATVLTPFQYIKHMEHLAPLTKRCIEYFIYVGISSWFLRQVNPDLWLTNLADIAAQLIAIFFISRVVVEVLTFLINSFFLPDADEAGDRGDRSRQTLAPLIVSLLRYTVYFAAIVMTMGRIGIDPTPLLAGAGILGVTVGLGAQKLVSDLASGFFIFFEGMFFVGDYIECADVEGYVEEVGVRITKVRDRGGVLHAIPNGEIRVVSSHSREYVNAIVSVTVGYEVDVRQVTEIIEAVGQDVHQDRDDILVATKVYGVEDFEEADVIFHTVTRVKPACDYEVRLVLRQQIKQAFDDANIDYEPRQVIHITHGSNREHQPPVIPSVDS